MEKPKIILKRSKIQTVVDFCLDQTIEFTVRQQEFPNTDWEVELNVAEIKTAIMVGMFLRENRLEMDGIDDSAFKKNAPKKAASKTNDVSEQLAEQETENVQSTMEETVNSEKEMTANEEIPSSNGSAPSLL